MTDSLERPRKLEFVRQKARDDRAAHRRELQRFAEGSPQDWPGTDP